MAVAAELTGSIAQEIKRPLDAILINAEAVDMLLAFGTDQRDALRETLAAIRRDDLRAGGGAPRLGTRQRLIGEFGNAAISWNRQRRVIARLEHDRHGANPRFVVTDLPGHAAQLYERVYSAPAARPKTASRKRRSSCSAAARVATSTAPTRCGCRWRRWTTR